MFKLGCLLLLSCTCSSWILRVSATSLVGVMDAVTHSVVCLLMLLVFLDVLTVLILGEFSVMVYLMPT